MASARDSWIVFLEMRFICKVNKNNESDAALAEIEDGK